MFEVKVGYLMVAKKRCRIYSFQEIGKNRWRGMLAAFAGDLFDLYWNLRSLSLGEGRRNPIF